MAVVGEVRFWLPSSPWTCREQTALDVIGCPDLCSCICLFLLLTWFFPWADLARGTYVCSALRWFISDVSSVYLNLFLSLLHVNRLLLVPLPFTVPTITRFSHWEKWPQHTSELVNTNDTLSLWTLDSSTKDIYENPLLLESFVPLTLPLLRQTNPLL